ncbi:hypothetical protein PIB30_106152, partial [Stylosanthes scabra]|nr:hypothetical protein [Stylosanthes scabra]
GQTWMKRDGGRMRGGWGGLGQVQTWHGKGLRKGGGSVLGTWRVRVSHVWDLAWPSPNVAWKMVQDGLVFG